MLEQLALGHRVINIDQTWINDTNHKRRKWRLRGQSNSSPENKVSPRVSVQMAICTGGKLYCALTQVNTDSDVYCLFISKLVAKLTSEDRNWRQNTVLLIDGAKYQTGEQSIKHMKALGINVCVSAPYSYASAPIEYAFGFLKSVDLNPDRLSTGKR